MHLIIHIKKPPEILKECFFMSHQPSSGQRMRLLAARLLIRAASLLSLSSAQAHYDEAYSFDTGVKSLNPDWMAALPGAQRLSEISIPGTHDTMTFTTQRTWAGLDLYSRTQVMSLEDQLTSGIRFIDIRCRHISNSCQLHHGQVYLYTDLDAVLTTVTQFLAAHPSETVLMAIRGNEHTEADVTRSWPETFEAYRAQYAPYFWTNGGNNNPRLSEVRGKIVVMAEYFSTNAGISWPDEPNVQNAWELGAQSDLYGKWEKVKAHLTTASNGPRDRMFMNNLAAVNIPWALPYFVASGHSTPATDGSRPTTWLTTPGWASSYPDFPRLECYIGICSIYYEGINTLTADKLTNDTSLSRVGIVITDFPGKRLIEAVIAKNTVIANVALHKSTVQASTAAGGDSSRAVDGNTDGNFSSNSVTHTAAAALGDWWTVDLQGAYDVNQVVLFNRTDCCADRLSNFYVRLLDARFRTIDLRYVGDAVNGRLSLPFKRQKASFLIIQLNKQAPLSLAEVIVRDNLALGQPATQSSTDVGGLASRAVDGNTDGNWGSGSVTHTVMQANPWWMVDLGQVKKIDQVAVWNRTDCCVDRLSSYTVEILNTSGQVVKAVPVTGVMAKRTVNIAGEGQFVRIRLQGTNPLSLAEVDVFGQQ